jgi:hypothetical protein
MRPIPLRRAAAVAATILAAATLMACATGNTPTSGTNTATGAGAAGGVPTTSAPAPTTPAPTTPSITYPSDAAAYAAAVRVAWKDGDTATLNALIAGSVGSELSGIPGSTNQNWHVLGMPCQGAAGSSFCFAYNDNGDKLTIKLDNQLLGQAHAVNDVQFNATALTGDVVAEFVGAWLEGNTWRMQVLAGGTVTAFATGHATPTQDYKECGNSGMGTSFITVYSPSGPDYAFRVHLDPSITPPIYDLASTGAPTVQGPGIC